jgi:hypothetical protein
MPPEDFFEELNLTQREVKLEKNASAFFDHGT